MKRTGFGSNDEEVFHILRRGIDRDTGKPYVIVRAGDGGLSLENEAFLHHPTHDAIERLSSDGDSKA